MRLKFSGFTILQVIISIALMAILMAIVYFAINPAKNFAEARNEQRASDLKSLMNGLQQYSLNNNGKIYPGIDSSLRMIGTASSGCTMACTVVNDQGVGVVNNYSYQANSALNFNTGTYINTFYNNATSMLELNAAGKTAKTGTYTSSIIDAQSSVGWSSLQWLPQDKYVMQLPDNKATVNAGAAGTISMSGNQLLLHLNETSGSTFADSSGSNNNATSNNVSFTTGYFDKALQFNGSSSNLIIPNNASLNPTTALTLEAWVKWNINPSSGANWAQIIDKNVDDQYQLQHSQTNNAFEFALRTSTGRRYILGTTAPVQGVWYHIVATYDGSFMRIYVNGNFERSGAATGTINTSTTPVYIGSRTTSDRNFNGVIDEVAIYSRALSASEISSRYNAGKSELKFQVRTCPDLACASNQFVGPDLTSSSYYNASQLSNLAFSNTLIGRYFQYKIIFGTGSSSFTPRISQINISTESLNVSQTSSNDSCINFQPMLNGIELPFIPADPSNGTAAKTNYAIRQVNGIIQLYACGSESNAIIMRSFH